MSEIPKPPEKIQPPLFAPDGTPSPELIAANKQFEDENKAKERAEWNERLRTEAEENKADRRFNRAP